MNTTENINFFSVVVFIKHFHFRTWLIFICKQLSKLLLKTAFLLFLWQVYAAPLSSHFPVHLVGWPSCACFRGLVLGSRVFAMPWGKKGPRSQGSSSRWWPGWMHPDSLEGYFQVAAEGWSSCIWSSCNVSLVTIKMTMRYLLAMSLGSSSWRELTRLGTRLGKDCVVLFFPTSW